MRFLIKVAFWLTIIVLLLPADPSKQTDEGRAQVGPFEALGAAQAAVQDVGGFCARRPDACEVGSQAFQTFGEKAQHGAKLLYEFLSSRFAEETSSSTASSTATSPRTTGSIAAPERQGTHTLTPGDLEPDWRGPSRQPVAVPLPPRRPV